MKINIVCMLYTSVFPKRNIYAGVIPWSLDRMQHLTSLREIWQEIKGRVRVSTVQASLCKLILYIVFCGGDCIPRTKILDKDPKNYKHI